MYSFTKARKKTLFAEDTKLWLIFISAVSALMIFFSLFLLTKIYLYKKDINDFTTEIIKDNKQIKDFKQKIAFIKKEKVIVTQIDVNNELLKDGVKNLLDLIPDPITLTHIKIEKNSLYIYGITPSKEVYNLLLLPPLKSIFTQTITNFYQMDNGWYRFESINTLKEEQ
jgi:cell division protein FtsL